MPSDKHIQANGRIEAAVADLSTKDVRVHRARARYELANRLFKGAIAVAAATSLGLLIYLAGSANAGAEAIQDCTTPGGECHTRSQKQTAVVVAQIVAAQREAAATGSAPARENLRLTQTNAQNLNVILGILDREYPEAAAAVRAELGVK